MPSPASPCPRDESPGRSPSLRELALAGVVAATALFWWTFTDRLDLPKQGVLVLGALAAWTVVLARRRRVDVDWISAALLAAPVVVLVVAPGETAARVEGWAGWVAAVALFLLARRASVRGLLTPLTVLALGLAAVAWGQALGAGWFGAHGSGRRRLIIGTLGGPAHLGWTLAMLLPWAGTRLLQLRPRVSIPALTGLVVALILTGARTSWAATLVAAPFWIPGDRGRTRRWRRAAGVAGAVLGSIAVAVVLDHATHRAHLPQRIADLGDPIGSAPGRIYLWRVHLHALPSALGIGGGPEAFVRRWPAWQRSFRAAHPEITRFHSDLRHAHVDLFEVLVDFGVLGLAFALGLIIRALLRRPDERTIRGPPLASLVALGVAGLAEAPLFFAPSLALGAVCLGLRFGPGRPAPPWLRAVPAVALALTLVVLGRRLGSEVHRSASSWLRGHGDKQAAYRRSVQAVAWDPRNPRAWIELGRIQRRLGWWPSTLESWKRALHDLPLDSLRQRLDKLRRSKQARLDRRPRP